MALLLGIVFVVIVVNICLKLGPKIWPNDDRENAAFNLALIVFFVLLPLIGFLLSQ